MKMLERAVILGAAISTTDKICLARSTIQQGDAQDGSVRKNAVMPVLQWVHAGYARHDGISENYLLSR